MKQTLDVHRASLIIGVAALLCFGWLAFTLVSADTVAATTWISFFCSILLGGVSLYLTLANPREILVIREKTIQETEAAVQTENEQNAIDLQGIKQALQNNKNEAAEAGLKAVCKQLDAGQGAMYKVYTENDIHFVKLLSGYALAIGENQTIQYTFGEGLIGQAAAENKSLYIDEVPEGYMKVVSGLGMASPRYLYISPIKKNDKVEGVLEISTFKKITETQRKFIDEAAGLIGQNL
ncbi:MAG: GAF domain-containing protein [Chryseotalea sp.]|jgi:hypothetical protein